MSISILKHDYKTGIKDKSIIEKLPNKLDWIILFFAMALIYCSYTYYDIVVTTRHSMNFWTLIFQGRPLDFYSYNMNVGSGNIFYYAPTAAIYDFSIYLVFAIFDLPLWILENFAKIDVMNNFACLLWMKVPLIIGIWVSAKLVGKIYKLHCKDKVIYFWLIFTYLSSLLLFSSVLQVSQYDIISLCFILAGVFYYLKNDYKKFLMYFALAVSFKYFAIFVFLPLIVMKNKLIWKIVRDIIIGSSISIFWKVIFLFGNNVSGNKVDIYHIQMSKLIGIFRHVFDAGRYPFSIFVVMYFAILVYCYITKFSDILDNLYMQTIFVCFLVYGAFCTFATVTSYWIILLVPFMILITFNNIGFLKINLYLEIVFSASMFFCEIVDGLVRDTSYLLNSMLWGVVTGNNHSYNSRFELGINKILLYTGSGLPNSIPAIFIVFSSITVGAIICLAYLNRPSNTSQCNENEAVIDKNQIRSRLFINVCLALVPVGFYLFRVLSYK